MNQSREFKRRNKIFVVRDVLKYAFNEPEPTPNQILRIIRNAEEWFENAQVGDYRCYKFEEIADKQLLNLSKRLNL